VGKGGEVKKDFVSMSDIDRVEFFEIVRDACILKKDKQQAMEKKPLKGKVLAMLFEKPSLRTRFTFEAGIYELGGMGIYFAPADISIGKRESVEDIAKNLSRWASGIMARTFEHSTVTGLAENSTIPVINGLSNLEHPCQILADFQTIYEKKGKLENVKLAFIGDGNNVCNSMMLASGIMGIDFRAAYPEGYEPDKKIVAEAQELASASGGSILLTNDPKEAAQDVDVIYTDVWASMGFKDEAEGRRIAFKSFQVNKDITFCAANDYIFMHCLPAIRGEEVTADIIDGPNSVIFDQAENRLHAQKALMLKLMR
jgi:ornithine carbamoyltransferase